MSKDIFGPADFSSSATRSVAAMRARSVPDDIIIAELLGLIKHMDKCIQSQCDKLMDLAGIAPRRMKAPDGRVYVWRCPAKLIPLSESPFSADWGAEMRSSEPELDTAHAGG